MPSDGWGQLLIYRKDLFDAAGLSAPRTLEDVERAAGAPGHATGAPGITLATAPGKPFTAETFEHVALISGCQLVDELGDITLTSPRCRAAFRALRRAARGHSPRGLVQDVDNTRDTYFAGKAAMIFWSPFLLDAMAGLRDDALPDVPASARPTPPTWRATAASSSLLSSADARRRRSSAASRRGASRRAPRSRPPSASSSTCCPTATRAGSRSRRRASTRSGRATRNDPERYERAWARLRSGVDRKAPLRRFYSAAAIQALGDGRAQLPALGLRAGAGAARRRAAGVLAGHARARRRDPRRDSTPPTAARRAQAAVEKARASLK